MIGKTGNLKEPIKFVIPLNPVTKKNSQQLFTNKKTGARFPAPSEKYRQYEKDAGHFLRGKFAKIEDPVNVQAIYYRKTRHRVDLTNLHEALHDVLVHYGVIADDSALNPPIIVSTDGSRVKYDKKNPRTEVLITPAADEPCQVMMEMDLQDRW